MAKLKSLLLAGLALSALVVTSSATPIVTNGSFETPARNTYINADWTYFSPGADIGGWHVDNVGGTVSTDLMSSDYNVGGFWRDAVEGNAYLYLADSLGLAQISQFVHLEAGRNYELSFWLADFNGYGPSHGARITTNLTALIGGTSVFSSGAQTFTQAYASNWTEYSLAFTAASGGDFVLSFTSSGGYASNLDDIQIADLGPVSVGVPDTGSTVGLLAGALVVAAAFRRRFAR